METINRWLEKEEERRTGVILTGLRESCFFFSSSAGGKKGGEGNGRIRETCTFFFAFPSNFVKRRKGEEFPLFKRCTSPRFVACIYSSLYSLSESNL